MYLLRGVRIWGRFLETAMWKSRVENKKNICERSTVNFRLIF
jgi:hypothetical protein